MNNILRLLIIFILCSFLNNFVYITERKDLDYLIAFNKNQKDEYQENFYDSMLVHNVIEEKEALSVEAKKIYIYNTHQTEKYQTNTVMDGARYLKELLEDKGYNVVFEETSFDQYKKDNQMDLTETYPTSRVFLNTNSNQYGPFDLIIDFHRDALSRENSYVVIDGVSYAKMMLVIGGSSGKVESVSYNSRMLREAVTKIKEGIMRSDFFRNEAIYNQDYSDNMLLIEVGGNTNTFEEVKHSLEVLAQAIDNCLREDVFI